MSANREQIISIYTKRTRSISTSTKTRKNNRKKTKLKPLTSTQLEFKRGSLDTKSSHSTKRSLYSRNRENGKQASYVDLYSKGHQIDFTLEQNLRNQILANNKKYKDLQQKTPSKQKTVDSTSSFALSNEGSVQSQKNFQAYYLNSPTTTRPESQTTVVVTSRGLTSLSSRQKVGINFNFNLKQENEERTKQNEVLKQENENLRISYLKALNEKTTSIRDLINFTKDYDKKHSIRARINDIQQKSENVHKKQSQVQSLISEERILQHNIQNKLQSLDQIKISTSKSLSSSEISQTQEFKLIFKQSQIISGLKNIVDIYANSKLNTFKIIIKSCSDNFLVINELEMQLRQHESKMGGQFLKNSIQREILDKLYFTIQSGKYQLEYAEDYGQN